MSLIVQNIRNGIKTQVTTTLTGYTELPYWNEIQKNDYRRIEKGYAVRALSAESVDGVLKHITYDHSFELILSRTVTRLLTDSDIEVVENDLFNQGGQIYRAMVATKLGLSANVLAVQDPSFGEPEFLSENNAVILRMQFIVKYRETLNN